MSVKRPNANVGTLRDLVQRREGTALDENVTGRRQDLSMVAAGITALPHVIDTPPTARELNGPNRSRSVTMLDAAPVPAPNHQGQSSNPAAAEAPSPP
jgi:hypothetical protein